MANPIASLFARLSLDSAAFEKGAKRAQASMGKLQAKMDQTGKKMQAIGKRMSLAVTAPLATGTALMVRNATSAAVEIDRLAKVSNSSRREFQRFAVGAKRVGVENDKLADILKDVNDRVGDFVATGGGPMKDFFDNIGPKVGVTADDFAKLSGPQALQLYVSSLEKAGVSQQEMTFYLEAMASDLTLLQPLLAKNGAEMNRLGDAAQEAGAILDEKTIESLLAARGSLAQLGKTGEGLRNKLVAALAPTLEKLAAAAEKLSEYFSNMSPEMQRFAAFAGIAAAVAGPLLIALGLMVSGFAALASPIGLVVAAFAALASPVGAAAAAFAAVNFAFSDFQEGNVAIFEYAKKVGKDFLDAFDGKQATISLIDSFGAATKALVEGFSSAQQAVAALGGLVVHVGALMGVWDETKGQSFGAFLGVLAQSGLEAAGNGLVAVANGMKAMADATLALTEADFAGVVSNLEKALILQPRGPDQDQMQAVADYMQSLEGLAVRARGLGEAGILQSLFGSEGFTGGIQAIDEFERGLLTVGQLIDRLEEAGQSEAMQNTADQMIRLFEGIDQSARLAADNAPQAIQGIRQINEAVRASSDAESARAQQRVSDLQMIRDAEGLVASEAITAAEAQRAVQDALTNSTSANASTIQEQSAQLSSLAATSDQVAQSISGMQAELDGVQSGLSSAQANMTAFSDGAKGIVSAVTNAIAQATAVVGDFTVTMINKGSEAMVALGSGISSQSAAPVGAVESAKSQALAALAGWAEAMYQAGVEAMNGLTRGIVDAAQGAADAAAEAAAGVAAAARDALDIRSPSRVMRKIGQQTIEGMAVGMSGEEHTLVDQMAKTGSKLAEEAEKAGGNVGNAFASAFFDFLKSGFKDVEGLVKSLLSHVTSAIQSGMNSIGQAVGGGSQGALGGIFGQGGFFQSIGQGFGSIFQPGGLKGIGSLIKGATSSLAGFGAALGAIGGVASIAAAAVSFFQTKTELLAQGIRLTVNDLDVVVESWEKIRKTRFWGLSSDTSTNYSEADWRVQDVVADQVMQLQSSVRDAAEALGIAGDAFNDFAFSTQVEFDGEDAEGALQALQAGLKEMTDAYALMAFDAAINANRATDAAAQMREAVEGQTMTYLEALQTLNNFRSTDMVNGQFTAEVTQAYAIYVEQVQAHGQIIAGGEAAIRTHLNSLEAELRGSDLSQTMDNLAEFAGESIRSVGDGMRAIQEEAERLASGGIGTVGLLLNLQGAGDGVDMTDPDEVTLRVLRDMGLAKAGEGASDALLRLADSLTTFNAIADTLGRAMFEVGLQGGKMASELVDLFGDLETMQERVNSYYNLFYTEQERLDTLTRQTTEALADLGYQMPTTRDAFRALVDAQDMTTEAGQQAFAALISMAGAIDQIIPAADEAAGGINGLSDALSALTSEVRTELSQTLSALRSQATGIRSGLRAQVSDLTAQIREAQSLETEARRAVGSFIDAMAEETADKFADALASVRSVLDARGAISADQSFAMYRAAQANLARYAAGAGYTMRELDQALDAVGTDQSRQFATYVDFARDYARTTQTLRDLEATTADQLSEAEQQIEALRALYDLTERSFSSLEAAVSAMNVARADQSSLQAQIIVAETIANAQIGAIESQVAALEAQAYQAGVLGSRFDTLAEAIASLEASMRALELGLDFVPQAPGGGTTATGTPSITNVVAGAVSSYSPAAAAAIQAAAAHSDLYDYQRRIANTPVSQLKPWEIKDREIHGFSGGGFTGWGSRAGGLDGEGGFLAMLHPRETVVDHHRGQGMPGLAEMRAELRAIKNEIAKGNSERAQDAAHIAKDTRRQADDLEQIRRAGVKTL